MSSKKDGNSTSDKDGQQQSSTIRRIAASNNLVGMVPPETPRELQTPKSEKEEDKKGYSGLTFSKKWLSIDHSDSKLVL